MPKISGSCLFNAAVPGVETISAMRKWMNSAADLAGYEPLFDGLRLAGVGVERREFRHCV